MATLEGRTFRVTHLDKVLWPDGTTKASVLSYYTSVAPMLVPHVRGRAATFLRTPAGVEGPRMYVQEAPSGLPDWIPTMDRLSRSGNTKRHVCIEDAPTLLVMANLYCLEIHTPQWTVRTGREFHDRIVFDLDPGEGAGFAECCHVAVMLREHLLAAGFAAVPATSGGKGLHVFTPVGNAPAEAAIGYARELAVRLTEEHPRRITHVRGPRARAGGKVLVDWAQNTGSSTTAAPYTLRASPGAPTVSAPVTWDEVESCDTRLLELTPAQVLERIEEHGDLAAPLLV